MSRGDGSGLSKIPSLGIERGATIQPPSLARDATVEQKLQVIPLLVRTVEGLNQTVVALHDIIVSQQLTPLRVSGACLRTTVDETRKQWTLWQHEKRSLRVALAVFHGLVEQCFFTGVDPRQVMFLEGYLSRIEDQRADAAALENDARACGLPVCVPEEDVRSMSADFGFVEEITDHQARVILLDESDREIKSDVTVPLVWLPRAYRREGAGVAWVERQYALGVKGRFEPAGAAE